MEGLAIQSMWIARAQNEKRVTVKKLFDAEKQRRKIETGKKQERINNEIAKVQFERATNDLKKYFAKKGG